MTAMKTIDTGTLASRALLVDVDIHFWNGKRSDKTITNDANSRFKTEGNYSKQLVPTGELTELNSAYHTVAQTHKRYTLPWTDSGARILASGAYYEYDREMRKAVDIFSEAADKFAKRFPTLVQEQKEKEKSDSFNPNDYPSAAEIRRLFGVDFHWSSVPQGSDLRVGLSKDALAAVRSSINEDQQSHLETAVGDIADRINTVVGNMITRLREYKPAKGKEKATNTFRDSLILNVRELAELLPKVNITGDQRIDNMSKQLLQLVDVTPDELRDDTRKRKTVVDNAEEILQKVSQFI